MDLSALKSSLENMAQSTAQLPAHVEACRWFLSASDHVPTPSASSAGSSSYAETAALGYRLAHGEVAGDAAAAFVDGASQLAGRTYFAGGRAARFEIDGVALLGLSLGYWSQAVSSDDTQWLAQLLPKSIDALASDPWQASLVRAAHAILVNATDWAEIDPVLVVSLRSALGQMPDEAEQAAAWTATVAGLIETDLVRCAAFLGVFETCASALARLPVHKAGIAELIEVLEGLSQSMSHWTYETKPRVRNVPEQRWEIDHEYHVQNLLWTVLRPIFPDLVDEETLKKLGHTSPRYDLGLPSLHTIIEVKYMRSRGQAQLKKITDEVAADHSLYLRSGTGFTNMIVFIWDEHRQTEEYKTLCDGLEALVGIDRVIILPRPAKMERLKADDA